MIYSLVFARQDNNFFLCWAHVSTVRFCQVERTVTQCVRVCVCTTKKLIEVYF